MYTHPNYQPNTASRPNDIGILRLKKPAPRNDFIKPICLPPSDIEKDIYKPKKYLSIAGWGKTKPEALYGSKVKLKAKIPIFPYENCIKVYKDKGILLSPNQICGGGYDKKDSCRGDSGGPLMFLDDSDLLHLRWYVIGIISFGYKDCGTPGIPSIYTKVTSYLPWIKEIISQ